MSTLSATNLKNASSGSNNIVLNTDGTIGGACLASTSEVQGTHTTGTVTSGTTSLTVASATGITAGMYVVGEGITPGTTVSSIASTTVTLSANANTTLSSDPVSFYATGKVLTPGLVAGQLCRAWVNFNGTGTVAIRAAYNVSSITDSGVGRYTVNFTTALPDANYCVASTASYLDASSNAASLSVNENTVPTTTGVAVRANQSSNNLDPVYCTVSIFR